jgi:hypothetical protein
MQDIENHNYYRKQFLMTIPVAAHASHSVPPKKNFFNDQGDEAGG